MHPDSAALPDYHTPPPFPPQVFDDTVQSTSCGEFSRYKPPPWPDYDCTEFADTDTPVIDSSPYDKTPPPRTGAVFPDTHPPDSVADEDESTHSPPPP